MSVLFSNSKNQRNISIFTELGLYEVDNGCLLYDAGVATLIPNSILLV